jgi:ABC-type branched-subunit amino acid transport system permease subunit
MNRAQAVLVGAGAMVGALLGAILITVVWAQLPEPPEPLLSRSQPRATLHPSDPCNVRQTAIDKARSVVIRELKAELADVRVRHIGEVVAAGYVGPDKVDKSAYWMIIGQLELGESAILTEWGMLLSCDVTDAGSVAFAAAAQPRYWKADEEE